MSRLIQRWHAACRDRRNVDGGFAVCQAPSNPIAEARALLDSGKTQEPETILRNYLVDNPTSADAHFLLGYVLFREQNAKESLAEFTAGAKFRRPRADELKIVAADYVILGAFSDADKWLSQVVAETPDDADSWYLLGRAKYSESEFPAAISAFERALSLRPRHIEAENNIGLCWKELNDREKARAAFQAAIDWQGDVPSDAQPFLNLGTLLADDQKNDQALPYLIKAAALSPNNPAIHEELGKAYLAMNKLPGSAGGTGAGRRSCAGCVGASLQTRANSPPRGVAKIAHNRNLRSARNSMAPTPPQRLLTSRRRMRPDLIRVYASCA